MGLVTEYYLSATLEKVEEKGRRAEQLWESSSIRDYLEASMDFEYVEGEKVEYNGTRDLPSETAVVEDTRPLSNLFTGLSPKPPRYKLKSGGTSITVSEDDIL